LLHCSIFELGKQESDDAERMIAFLMKYDRRKVFFSIKKPKNELSGSPRKGGQLAGSSVPC